MTESTFCHDTAVSGPCLHEAVGRAVHFAVFLALKSFFFFWLYFPQNVITKLQTAEETSSGAVSSWQSDKQIKAGDYWQAVPIKGPVDFVVWLHHYLPPSLLQARGCYFVEVAEVGFASSQLIYGCGEQILRAQGC